MAFSNFFTVICTFILPFVLLSDLYVFTVRLVPQSTQGPLVQKDLILTRQLSLVTLLEIHSRIPPALHLTSLSSLWQLSHLCLLPFLPLTVAYSSRSFREGMVGNTPGSRACYCSLASPGKSVKHSHSPIIFNPCVLPHCPLWGVFSKLVCLVLVITIFDGLIMMITEMG